MLESLVISTLYLWGTFVVLYLAFISRQEVLVALASMMTVPPIILVWIHLSLYVVEVCSITDVNLKILMFGALAALIIASYVFLMEHIFTLCKRNK